MILRVLVAVLLLAPCAFGAAPLWVHRGPAAADVTDLIVIPGTGTLFAATQDGLFRSTDGAVAWTRVDDFPRIFIEDLALDSSNPNRIYAAGWSGLYVSEDGGARWRQLRADRHVLRVFVDPREAPVLYISIPASGTFRSTDGGSTWTQVQLLSAEIVEHAGRLYSIVQQRQLYTSSDGLTWNPVTTPANVGRIFSSGDALWAFASATLLKSTDDGATWTAVPRPGSNYSISSFAADPATGTLYAGTFEYGAFSRAPTDTEWRPLGFPVAELEVGALAFADGVVYAGTTGRGVLRLPAGGATWIPAAIPMHTSNAYAVYVDGEMLLTGTSGGIFRSTDGGKSHQSVLNTKSRVLAIADIGDALLAATWIHGLYRSTDDGRTWQHLDSSPVFVNQMAVDPRDTRRIAIATNFGVAVSTNGGQSWTYSLSNAIPSVVFDPVDSSILIGAPLRRSVDSGATWAPVADVDRQPVQFTSVWIDPRSPDRLYAASFASGLYASTDRGRTWSLVDTRIAQTVHFAVAGDAIYAATPENGIFRSTDGVTWELWEEPSSMRVKAILIEPAPSRRIWLATSGGPLRSADPVRRRSARH